MVHGAVLAAVTPSNTPGGSNLTALFPTAIFIIQAAVLYLRFRRRPQAVPGHVALAASHWAHRGRPMGGSGAGDGRSAAAAPSDSAEAPSGDAGAAPGSGAYAAAGAPGESGE